VQTHSDEKNTLMKQMFCLLSTLAPSPFLPSAKVQKHAHSVDSCTYYDQALVLWIVMQRLRLMVNSNAKAALTVIRDAIPHRHRQCKSYAHHDR